MEDNNSFKLLYDHDKIYTLKEKKLDNKKSKEETIQTYIKKLEAHISAISDVWVYQLAPFVVDMLDDEDWDDVEDLIAHHDISKISDLEFNKYCDTPRCYLDGYNENNIEDMFQFNEHIHTNPHHWQYYLVTDSDGITRPIEIPFPYLLEMLCDWHSYSRLDKNRTAYNYWNQNKDKIIVTDNIRESITVLTRFLQIPLESSDFYRKMDDNEVKLMSYLDEFTNKIEYLLSWELGDDE